MVRFALAKALWETGEHRRAREVCQTAAAEASDSEDSAAIAAWLRERVE